MLLESSVVARGLPRCQSASLLRLGLVDILATRDRDHESIKKIWVATPLKPRNPPGFIVKNQIKVGKYFFEI